MVRLTLVCADCSACRHRDREVGEISCQVCLEKFQCSITCEPASARCCWGCCEICPLVWPIADLSEPIDVYAQWIDACEAARPPEDE